jgi:predicted transcriptional regulator
MRAGHQSQLSRRERQIMEIVYRLGKVTVTEVQVELAEAPSYSAVRALLRILEAKGHLRHTRAGRRYYFEAVVPHETARGSALRGLLDTFFGGSRSKLVAALLDDDHERPSARELEIIAGLIEQSRRRGR